METVAAARLYFQVDFKADMLLKLTNWDQTLISEVLLMFIP